MGKVIERNRNLPIYWRLRLRPLRARVSALMTLSRESRIPNSARTCATKSKYDPSRYAVALSRKKCSYIAGSLFPTSHSNALISAVP